MSELNTPYLSGTCELATIVIAQLTISLLTEQSALCDSHSSRSLASFSSIPVNWQRRTIRYLRTETASKSKSLAPKTVDAIAKLKTKPTEVQLVKECGPEALAEVVKWEGITSLFLKSEKFENLDALKPMPSLVELKIDLKKSKEKPIDLGPVGKLTNLESLDCNSTKVTNTAALKGCSKLKKIVLFDSDVDSIEFLNSTPNVEQLAIGGSRHTFPDYQPVTSLKKLKILSIVGNQQANDETLAVLKSISTIEEMQMNGCNKVTTLDSLSGSTGLKELIAGGQTLEDASVLEKMKDLEMIRMGHPNLNDLSIFKGKTKLTVVTLLGCKAESLAGLEDSKQLTKLDVRNSTTVSDISALEGMSELYTLNLSNTAVTDLSVLKSMKKPGWLDISDTKVSDLSPLADHPRLYNLTCRNSGVNDISVLPSIEGITSFKNI